jgi:hypothetical protein
MDDLNLNNGIISASFSGRSRFYYQKKNDCGNGIRVSICGISVPVTTIIIIIIIT